MRAARSARSAGSAGRYGGVAIALHWTIGALLLAQLALGFLVDEIAPRGSPDRGAVINLHKSFGLTLAALVVLRLAWRLAHRPPPLPPTIPPWQRRFAHATHLALYACMLAMPAAGYVASNFSKHGIRLYGIALAPWGPDLPEVYRFFNGLHDTVAIAFIALIGLHVAAALKHAWVDRDGVLARMRPGRA